LKSIGGKSAKKNIDALKFKISSIGPSLKLKYSPKNLSIPETNLFKQFIFIYYMCDILKKEKILPSQQIKYRRLQV